MKGPFTWILQPTKHLTGVMTESLTVMSDPHSNWIRGDDLMLEVIDDCSKDIN